MTDPLRVYFDPAEIGPDGYPHAWHRPGWARLLEAGRELAGDAAASAEALLGPEPPAIKDLIRAQAGNRCERCGHPYEKGKYVRGEWTPCDEQCGPHGGPYRWIVDGEYVLQDDGSFGPTQREAQWRILTVHHLNGVKHDCRWWNLAALCQRCHLTIQGKVYLDRPWDKPHTEWFRPHAAGFYAAELLGWELTKDEVLARTEEILQTQLRQPRLEGF